MANGLLYIGIAAVVVVLLVLFALDRWEVFGNNDENTDSGTDRIRRDAERDQDFSIPFLKKHKTLTFPGKVVMTCVLLLFVGGLVYGYLVLRGGAPAEIPYANAMKQGAVAVFAVGAGVAYANKKTAHRGRLDVVYETDDGSNDHTETVWFAPGETNRDKNGNLVVYEHFATRFLGLFGRRKLVGHDRELRSRRAILGDLVAHRIPDHAVQVGQHHYLVRTQGRKVTDSVAAATDYDYRAPYELPYESYVNQREKLRKMEIRFDSMKAQFGEAQTEIQRLRRKIENEEYRSHEDLLDELRSIREILGPQHQDVTVQQDRRRQRHPNSQRDLDDLPSDTGEAST